jgi:hypothetical protein
MSAKGTCLCSGTFYESSRFIGGVDEEIIVMRIKYFAALVIATLSAGIGLAVNPFGSLSSKDQSTPATMQMADRLAESVDPFLLRSGG